MENPRETELQAMEDGRWSIKTLRVVNSFALKEGFKERSSSRCGCRVSQKQKDTTMKLTTIALAIAFALPSTFAFARGGISVGSQAARPYSGFTAGSAGRIATMPRNFSGNTLAPVMHDPSGSTLAPAATNRG